MSSSPTLLFGLLHLAPLIPLLQLRIYLANVPHVQISGLWVDLGFKREVLIVIHKICLHFLLIGCFGYIREIVVMRV